MSKDTYFIDKNEKVFFRANSGSKNLKRMETSSEFKYIISNMNPKEFFYFYVHVMEEYFADPDHSDFPEAFIKWLKEESKRRYAK